MRVRLCGSFFNSPTPPQATSMNSPRHNEMDKLRQIQSHVDTIARRVDERLPAQRAHLAAFVSTVKWRLMARRPQSQEEVDAVAKRLRMEVGAFEYSAKEQSELLTRHLCDLDNILSHGNMEIKDARKALVLAIQTLLERADAMKSKATALKEFTERVIARLPSVAQTVEDEAMETTDALPKEEETTMEDEHDEQTDVRPLFETEEEAESEHDDEEEEEEEEEQDADMEDEEQKEDPEEDAENTDQANEAIGANEQNVSNDEELAAIRSLPVWRPYYQIQKRPDGIYVRANLSGVDPRYLRVEAMPHNGMLRISGVKFPTQKDIIVSQWSGTPTFGRFEIVERFPTEMVSMDNATQRLLSDGTLQVRLPFYLTRPRPNQCTVRDGALSERQRRLVVDY